jgi:hypothetical protein
MIVSFFVKRRRRRQRQRRRRRLLVALSGTMILWLVAGRSEINEESTYNVLPCIDHV